MINNTASDEATSDNASLTVDFDITEAIVGWYNGNSANYGVAIKALEKYSKDSDPFNVSFYTADSGFRPNFTVSYINLSGFEDYYSTSGHSIGSITGAVNLANGNLTLS